MAQSSGASSGYTRLADEDGSARRASEAASRALEPIFAKLQERLSQRAAHRGPGVVAMLSIGKDELQERWIVDTRESCPPTAAVRRIDRHSALPPDPAPTFMLTVPSAEDFLAVLERRLPPFRALAQRRIVIKGDLGQLRSMSWLLGGHDAGPGDGGGSNISVRVLRAGIAAAGHGEYIVCIEEGATAWTVARRWSELKSMHADLVLLYGKGGGTLELPLPAIPTSLRSSTSSSLLARRSVQLEAHLAALLRIFPCSARAREGPPALVRFLLPDEEAAASSLPPPISKRTSTLDMSSLASSASGGPSEEDAHAEALARGELPLSELLRRRDTELRAAGSREFAKRVCDACAYTAGLVLLAIVAVLIGSYALGQLDAMFGLVDFDASARALVSWLPSGIRFTSSVDRPEQPPWSPPAPVASPSSPVATGALLALSTRALALVALAMLCLLGTALLWCACTLCTAGGRERVELTRRYLMVLALFWSVYAHYRVVRLRAKRLGWKEGDEQHVESEEEKALWEEAHDTAGRLLYHGMGRLGGLWIKQGQYLASRADMVPVQMGRHLAAMLDSNPPRPLGEVVSTLLAELGEETLREVATIDPTPLSVASIAQVHAATLVDGSRVVLKLQHVEIERKLLQDLLQAEEIAATLAWLEPQIDLRALLEEMASLHRSELDFTAEAANLRDVGANLRRRRVTVVLPDVIERLTTRKCLVMDFCEGRSLKDPVVLKAMGVDCTLLVTRVTEAWGAQMFADGVFNADPHPGNLLVRVDPQLGPLPVLLDFGLCKRLPHHQKIAFCRLVVALAHLDTDALVDALRDLGLELPKTIEPFQMLKGMAFAFRDTESDPHKARKRLTSTLRKSRKERNALKEAHKARDAKEASAAAAAAAAAQNDARAPHPPRRPPAAQQALPSLPGVVAYFYRTLMMLQGLSTTLGVSMAFMPPLARWAQQSLLEHNRERLRDVSPTRLPQAAAAAAAATSPRPSVRSSLHERTLRLLVALADTDELLGGQVCVYRRGVPLVDAAAGRLGPVDPTPTRTDSLFQIFAAGSPVLACLALQEATARGSELKLRSSIGEAWRAFATNGKGHHTLLDLLNHTIGLADPTPPDATLDDLCDADAMATLVAASTATAPPLSPPLPVHAGPMWGWALWGALRAATGAPLDVLIRRGICSPLGLPTDPSATELTLSVPPEAAPRVVTHDPSPLLKRSGLDLSEILSAPPKEEEEEEEEEEDGKDRREEGLGTGGRTAGGADEPPQPSDQSHAERGETPSAATAVEDTVDATAPAPSFSSLLGGARQRLAPHFLNMRKLRQAHLPGVSMHASARALAAFYDAFGGGRTLLPPSVVTDVVALSSSQALGGGKGGVRWAAGFQVGECVDSNGRKCTVLGHSAPGGTIGLCIPAVELALAVTVSKLSPRRLAPRKVIELVLSEYGLKLTPHAMPGLLSDE